jgi:hypothetical protein
VPIARTLACFGVYVVVLCPSACSPLAVSGLLWSLACCLWAEMAALRLIPLPHPLYSLFVVWRLYLLAVAVLPPRWSSAFLRRGCLLPLVELVGRQRVAGRKWHHDCETKIPSTPAA